LKFSFYTSRQTASYFTFQPPKDGMMLQAEELLENKEISRSVSSPPHQGHFSLSSRASEDFKISKVLEQFLQRYS